MIIKLLGVAKNTLLTQVQKMELELLSGFVTKL